MFPKSKSGRRAPTRLSRPCNAGKGACPNVGWPCVGHEASARHAGTAGLAVGRCALALVARAPSAWGLPAVGGIRSAGPERSPQACATLLDSIQMSLDLPVVRPATSARARRRTRVTGRGRSELACTAIGTHAGPLANLLPCAVLRAVAPRRARRGSSRALGSGAALGLALLAVGGGHVPEALRDGLGRCTQVDGSAHNEGWMSAAPGQPVESGKPPWRPHENSSKVETHAVSSLLACVPLGFVLAPARARARVSGRWAVGE